MANKIKILIVDDERPLARALELKLTHEGFEAKTALDGESAIEILKEEKFDLMILDLVMPKLDGFGVLKKMREIKNETPVIVVSNLSQKEDAKKSKELGAVDFFVKSDIPISDVVAKIKDTLKKV